MANLDLSNINYELYSEEKYQEIQRSILDTTRRIQETEANIHTLQVAIDAQRKRRQALLCDLGLYKAAVAPHKRLPEDILRKTFILCAHAYGTVQIPLRSNPCGTPMQLVLSHVCSLWRQIALSTGELWSDVCVSQLLAQGTIHTCKIWLQRAGNLPIAVKLGGFSESLNVTAIQNLFCVARITYLDLMICRRDLPMLRALPDDVLPDVREVRLSMQFNRYKSIPPYLPSFFQHARFFRCHRYLPNVYIHKLTLSWGGLRYLDLRGCTISTQQCFDILHQKISLEMCRLTVVESPTTKSAPTVDREFVFPKLRTLILEADRAAFDAIIPSISAPQLTRLSLMVTGQERLDIGDRIIGILTTRFNLHRLEELELFKLGSPVSLDVLLRNASSLRRITFPDSPRGNMSKDIISGLAAGNLGSCLESIEVPRVDGPDRIFEIFDMVELRQKNSNGESCDAVHNEVTPFKHVRISTRNPDICEPYEQYMKRIIELRELGAGISIDGYPMNPDPHNIHEGVWSELIHPSHIN
ncbi:hypothetical protein AX17_007088 [Amanita inopinata Kibby_2008]|nr:hypothetical protein AX17_007088 [Amanita inopinata Kibby_2008]